MLQKETLIEMNWEEDELYQSNKFSEHEIQSQPLGPDFFIPYTPAVTRIPSSRWPISHRALPALFPVFHLQHVMRHQHHHLQENKSPDVSFPHLEGKQISMCSSGCLWCCPSCHSIDRKRRTNVCTDLPYLPSMTFQTPLSHTSPQSLPLFHTQCSSHTWKPSKQRSGGWVKRSLTPMSAAQILAINGRGFGIMQRQRLESSYVCNYPFPLD